MAIFTGSGVAICTPFDESGVNEAEFARLIEFQIQEGTDAIIVCGTTGEPSTMTREEKQAAISVAVDTAKGRVPVIAGTGGNNTAAVIADSKAAQGLGADALLLVTPYYNKCTQAGLVAHFRAVSDAVSIPMIAYNVPARTGFNIQPQTLLAMADIKNVAAIKAACADITQITEMARLTRGKLDLYSGNDDHVVPLMSLGALGVISVLANVAPGDTHDMVAAYLAGDTKASLELQFKLNPLVQALFTEVNPIPVKAGLELMGFKMGGLRLPLTPLTAQNMERLRAAMQAVGISIEQA